MSKILILGGKGRVGAAMARKWSGRHTVTALARPEVDLSDLAALESLLIDRSFDVLVNAAAVTNVDRCEMHRAEALAVNTHAPGVMGRVAADKGARLIHLSTDYVFDGTKSSPYHETDPALPLSYYGETKLAGENEALQSSPCHVVTRISWVFGPDKPSFVEMIIERARTQDRVEAIFDKTSCPTSAEDVADWMEPFLTGDLPGGLYHACNTGPCTWQEYGQYALDCAARAGVSLQTSTVDPIPLSAMKAFLAPRPPHTAMATAKLAAAIGRIPRPWQEALAEYIVKKYS